MDERLPWFLRNRRIVRIDRFSVGQKFLLSEFLAPSLEIDSIDEQGELLIFFSLQIARNALLLLKAFLKSIHGSFETNRIFRSCWWMSRGQKGALTNF